MQGPFELRSERLGPLPLINHFTSRLGLADLIDDTVPTSDGRCRLAYAKAIGVLIRSIASATLPRDFASMRNCRGHHTAASSKYACTVRVRPSTPIRVHIAASRSANVGATNIPTST